MRAVDSTVKGLGVSLALLVLGVWVLPDWAIFLVTVALARGLVVLGLLVLWRSGLVSFGQALYFGVGGYAVGMVGLSTGISDIVLLTLLGTVMAGAVAWLVGLLVARYRDIFFAMLSMAFSMILYGILVKTEALGSTDGFNVITPTFLGYAPEGETMRLGIYLWTSVLAVLAGYVVHRYLKSTMGSLAVPIRDNEIRVEYLGVSVRRVVHVNVILAGALAGAGGVVTAFAVGHVDPESMTYWTTSGEFVFVTILSGTGSIVAPFLGSILFELIRTYAVQYAPHTWQMVLGGTLLLIILFLPNGLWSLVTRLRRRAPDAAA
jgi:branched-chain amino acid transport system permease protein